MVSFGDLRSLVQRNYTPRRWQDLCHLLDQAMSSVDAEVLRQKWIPYALDHIHKWPNRVAPRRWLKQAIDTGSSPALRLATDAHIGRREDEASWRWRLDANRQIKDAITPMSDTQAQRFLDCVDCDRLTFLQVNQQYLQSSIIYDALSSLPHWQQLEHLFAKDSQAQVGEQWSVLSRLRSWSAGFDLDEQPFIGFVTQGMLRSLEHLQVVGSKFYFSKHFYRQVEQGCLPNLKSVVFQWESWLDIGFLRRALKHWPKLDTLGLIDCSVERDVWVELLSRKECAQLRTLNLSGSLTLDPQTIKLLAESALFSQLEVLGLSFVEAESSELNALITSEHLASLHTLDLSYNLWPDANPWNKGLPALRTLKWVHREDDWSSLTRFLSGRRASQLTSLWLPGHVNAPNSTLSPLLACSASLPHLEALHLPACELTADALCALIREMPFPRLHALDLRNNYFDATCVDMLLSQPWITSLRHLDLRYNPLTVEDEARLLSAPNLSQCAFYF